MASTTGLTNGFVVTRDQVIAAALRVLRVLDPTQSPTATDITTGAEALNMMLKTWPTKGLLLWCRNVVIFPIVANKNLYTIGPVGADIIAARPLRVLDGTFIRLTTGAQTFDTPLKVLSRLDYQQLGAKSATGVPNSLYYDPQMNGIGGSGAYNPANSMGVVYLYVTPSDASRQVFLEVQRPLQDMSAAGDAFDVPPEWYRALKYGLAAELVDEYEVPEDRTRRVLQQAEKIVDEMTDWGAQEQAPTRFQPAYF